MEAVARAAKAALKKGGFRNFNRAFASIKMYGERRKAKEKSARMGGFLNDAFKLSFEFF